MYADVEAGGDCCTIRLEILIYRVQPLLMRLSGVEIAHMLVARPRTNEPHITGRRHTCKMHPFRAFS